METRLIVEIYRDNGAGLTPKEIAQIYEDAYIQQKAVSEANWWKIFNPNAGWLVAVVLGLLVIFKEVVSVWFSTLLKAAGKRVYNRVAGFTLFWGTALKHYKGALLHKYHEVPIPFRPDEFLKLRDVYVPLRVRYPSGRDQLDAYQTAVEQRRLVVRGEPGAGKTMLLKYILLSYGEGGMGIWPEAPVPIMLELARLNDPTISLHTALTEELQANEFPRGANFLNHYLSKGKIMLLLDGLDEVSSSERPRVDRMLRDFLSKYRECRVVLTCRAAAYDNEMSPVIKQVVEIVEFNDYQIQQFLRLWEPKMTADRSAEQLTKILEDRPHIMALARNPLLLTMIAFLYIAERYPLPHLRAEFYKKSVELLLRQLHPERNKFHWTDKIRVLEELALYAQDMHSQERLSNNGLSYETVLGIIRELRPHLAMPPDQDPDLLLREIVERSGLLITFDNGAHYQFVHRSLQEYFAAEKLEGKGKELAERFVATPNTWRETVKLWCGLSHNESTPLLKQVFKKEPLTALECLAEAQLIDTTFAERLINKHKARFDEAASDANLAQVLGLVAASPRPRGAELLSFLEDRLKIASNLKQRAAAANAISFTNLPQSATRLAAYYEEWDGVRMPLIRMGDMAVSELARLSKSLAPTIRSTLRYVHQKTWQLATVEEVQEAELLQAPKDLVPIQLVQAPSAMDDLLAIGTPKAAAGFVELLWSTDLEIAGSAAWRLAALLSRPDVEDSLHNYELTSDHLKTKPPKWFSRTFAHDNDSALTAIAGQVAYLIENAPLGTVILPPQTLDSRLAVPFCADKVTTSLNLEKLEMRPPPGLVLILSVILKGMNKPGANESIHVYDPSFKRSIIKATKMLARGDDTDSHYNSLRRRLVNEFCAAMHADQRWHYVMLCMRPNLQMDILGRIVGGSVLTAENSLEILAAKNISPTPINVMH